MKYKKTRGKEGGTHLTKYKGIFCDFQGWVYGWQVEPFLLQIGRFEVVTKMLDVRCPIVFNYGTNGQSFE